MRYLWGDERVLVNGIAARMKVRDVIRLIEADDWYLVATKGSHRQYKHKNKAGRVTIAGKLSDDVARER